MAMRLAHISDLHLLSLDGARVRDFLNERWTGGVNLLFNRGRHYATDVFEALVDDLNAQRVDQVLCTGDVTNLALETEFHFARARFDRIALGPANVTCIPGNHDSYVTRAVGLFERVFGDYCTTDDDWRWPGGEKWPTVRVRGDAAIIGLSTSEPSFWFLAHGHVGEAQLARLEQVLGDPRLAGKARVVLVHHPPAGRRAASWHRGLRDHARFADVIRRAGAELVLHGHEHKDLRTTLAGPGGREVPVHGIPSGSFSEDHPPERRARYRIYTINGGALHGEEVRAWIHGARRFDAGQSTMMPA